MPRAKQLDISEDILRIKRIRQIDIAQLIQRIEVEGGLDLIHCDARAALDREGKVLGDGDRRFFVRTARRFVEDDGRCDLAGAVNGQRRDMPGAVSGDGRLVLFFIDGDGRVRAAPCEVAPQVSVQMIRKRKVGRDVLFAGVAALDQVEGQVVRDLRLHVRFDLIHVPRDLDRGHCMRDTGCAGGELEDRSDHSLASTGIRCRVVIVEGDGAVVFFPGIQVCSGIRGIPVIPTAVCELHGDIFGLQCRAAGLDGSSELAAQQFIDVRIRAIDRDEALGQTLFDLCKLLLPEASIGLDQDTERAGLRHAALGDRRGQGDGLIRHGGERHDASVRDDRLVIAAPGDGRAVVTGCGQVQVACLGDSLGNG